MLTTIASVFHVGSGTASVIVTVGQLGYTAGIALLVPLGDIANRRRLADPQAVYDDFSGRIPAARIADPDEIASAYAYLIDSHFTTGTVLTADGGTLLV
ncbi:NAD(P)-dependent dehydrogenase (short-subunit alcohol dehydrogenase family) [Nocardia sp. GAS34]|uniref:SDR family oxidoreductase n=1 Tax=unclassified Nocardia TaxID=2637762 RepID=UPI003D25F8AD